MTGFHFMNMTAITVSGRCVVKMQKNELRKHTINRAKKHIALHAGVAPDSPLLITPSRKASDRLRKKLNRGEKPKKYRYDCNGCTDCNGCNVEPDYEDHPMKTCRMDHAIGQCRRCGIDTMYFVNPVRKWVHCPMCKEILGW